MKFLKVYDTFKHMINNIVKINIILVMKNLEFISEYDIHSIEINGKKNSKTNKINKNIIKIFSSFVYLLHFLLTILGNLFIK